MEAATQSLVGWEMTMKFSPILQSRAKPLSCQIKFNAQCTEFFLTALMVASQRGGLAPFMRASLIPVRDADGPFTSRSDMWPCPPQVWGRWTELSSLSPKRRRRHRFLRLKAQAVQKLVIAVNWLTLGHVMKPGPCTCWVPYEPASIRHAGAS